MTKVLLSSQAYSGADMRFINQLIHALAEQPKGIRLGYNFTQTSVIEVGLSIAATDFLKTDFDYFFSLDYDIIFNPHNDPAYPPGYEIKRLVDSCEETRGLVGAPYLKRGTEDQLCVVPLKEGEILVGPGGGLNEVRYLPTGCTMISREILQKVTDSMDLVRYDTDTWFYPFFMPMVHPDYDGTLMYLTLDFAFSQRVRDAGFKVFLDSRIILGHMGTKIYAVQRQ